MHYFISLALTHIIPPISTGYSLPSFLILYGASVNAANPHHPALGIA